MRGREGGEESELGCKLESEGGGKGEVRRTATRRGGGKGVEGGRKLGTEAGRRVERVEVEHAKTGGTQRPGGRGGERGRGWGNIGPRAPPLPIFPPHSRPARAASPPLSRTPAPPHLSASPAPAPPHSPGRVEKEGGNMNGCGLWGRGARRRSAEGARRNDMWEELGRARGKGNWEVGMKTDGG